MKKVIKRLLVLLALVITSVGLIACNEKPTPQPEPIVETEQFTVTFDTLGGSEIPSVKVDKDSKLTKPANPTKAGHEFSFWFLEEEFEFDFQTPITSNITLKASWTVNEYTVTFDSQGGPEIAPVVVLFNGVVTQPETPHKPGSGFNFWAKEDGTEFDFASPITDNLTLTANWIELTPEQQIEEDYQAVLASFVVSDMELNVPTYGPIHGSRIVWNMNSPYISNSGVVLPLLEGTDPTVVSVSATFRSGTTRVKREFNVQLKAAQPVVLTNSRAVEFTNLTTEYDILPGTLDLWFEEGGTVPYVNPENFLRLIEGFVDPEMLSIMQFTYEAGILTIYYPYFVEEENHTYELTTVIDSVNQTITTRDPGFYWAYVYSTETNYGRNIEYMDETYSEYSYESPGTGLVYDLGKYNLQIVDKAGEILLPFSLVNQLFAGSSYYNVFYNGDKLVGIYALPDEDSDEYLGMMDTSLRGTQFSPDLVVNNFNTLAFFMDHF